MSRVHTPAGIILTIALSACTQGPEPIRWGVDACELCRMIISDRRFVAELISDQGRIAKFDGVDELCRYQARTPGGRAYVGNGESGELIPAGAAVYLHSPDLRSPMGGHVMSFADTHAATAYAATRKLGRPRRLDFAGACTQVLREAPHAGR